MTVSNQHTTKHQFLPPIVVRYFHLLPLLLLPLVGSVAGRSASLLLIIWTLLLVADRYYHGKRPYFFIFQNRQLLICASACLIWLLLTVLWSIDPERSLNRFSKLLILVIPGIYCAHALEDRDTNHNFWPFLFSTFVGACIVCYYVFLTPVDVKPLFAGLFLIEQPYNRSLMVILLSSMILLNAVVCHWEKTSTLQRALSIGLFIFCAIMSWHLIILSQVLMIIVWVCIAVLIRVFPATTTLVCVTGIIGTLLLFPALSGAFTAIISYFYESIPAPLQSSYAGDGRFAIWARTIEYAMEHPVIGHGLGTEMLLPLIPVHPHSASLNILVNAGLIGSVLVTILALVYVKHCWENGKAHLEKTLPVFIALFAFANVNHGAWQSWWVALAFIALNPSLGLHRK